MVSVGDLHFFGTELGGVFEIQGMGDLQHPLWVYGVLELYLPGLVNIQKTMENHHV